MGQQVQLEYEAGPLRASVTPCATSRASVADASCANAMPTMRGLVRAASPYPPDAMPPFRGVIGGIPPRVGSEEERHGEGLHRVVQTIDALV
eukprot:CAMPEP_0181206982 /NCGR_PEP_ID=MMETSP1096-20121128/21330_1 /TAXON_ID=156174 ORGANISM="Chrysochromulina ericina, Strain CCMP281" /NCGR_SAMPLE_ID=MMETSP1096 /ASSEMBLY_ACC=CAM_ASM_000453 /LENGTH=91 /DNA_ID=CAMNT_0023297927 /DNA_START=245 /DNA_END=522 /DNA_ORIENTATION=-